MASTNRSPPIDTRSGAKGRDDGEAGSKPIRDDDGRRKRDEVSNHAGDGTRHISDGEIMVKMRELRPVAIDRPHCRHCEASSSPLPPPTRYHIAWTRKASRSRTQHDIAPLDDTRSGAGGEARQSDKEGEAINTAVSREKRGRMMNG